MSWKRISNNFTHRVKPFWSGSNILNIVLFILSVTWGTITKNADLIIWASAVIISLTSLTIAYKLTRPEAKPPLTDPISTQMIAPNSPTTSNIELTDTIIAKPSTDKSAHKKHDVKKAIQPKQMQGKTEKPPVEKYDVRAYDHATAIGKVENLSITPIPEPTFDLVPNVTNELLPVASFETIVSSDSKPNIDSFYLTSFKLNVRAIMPIKIVRVSSSCPSILNLQFALDGSGAVFGLQWGKDPGLAWMQLSNVSGKYIVNVRTANPEKVKIDITYELAN